jgi:uncharacterized membrane protein YfcA
MLIALFFLATLAGSVAAVAGFGIGSVLTPAMSLTIDIKVAVAAAAIPHLAGSITRCWSLRAHIDRALLVRFGWTSVVGGLAGALLGAGTRSPILTIVFGALLVFVSASHLAGVAGRLRFGGNGAWIAGALSGFFGGLVGNQGGLRSAALMGFDLPRERFVATATLLAIAVDAARVPVYLALHHRALSAISPLIVVATLGVLAGTCFGARVLRRCPEEPFRRVVAILLLALGVSMIATAIRGLR